MNKASNSWMLEITPRPRFRKFMRRFDKGITILASAGGQSPKADTNRPGRAIFIGLLAAFISLSCASTSFGKDWRNSEMNLKLYAHNQIRHWDQFICFVDLIEAESSWRYWVSNGSHHGLGQMRSEWYKNLKPRRQIDAQIKYINHRYGKPCQALRHYYRYGWH